MKITLNQTSFFAILFTAALLLFSCSSDDDTGDSTDLGQGDGNALVVYLVSEGSGGASAEWEEEAFCYVTGGCETLGGFSSASVFGMDKIDMTDSEINLVTDSDEPKVAKGVKIPGIKITEGKARIEVVRAELKYDDHGFIEYYEEKAVVLKSESLSAGEVYDLEYGDLN